MLLKGNTKGNTDFIIIGCVLVFVRMRQLQQTMCTFLPVTTRIAETVNIPYQYVICFFTTRLT